MIRPGSSLTNKANAVKAADHVGAAKKVAIPSLDDLLGKCDFSGAIALLLFEQKTGKARESNEFWLAYCYFHSGHFEEALAIYRSARDQLQSDGHQSISSASLGLFSACCYFSLFDFEECQSELNAIQKAALPESEKQLAQRLSMHLSHHRKDGTLSPLIPTIENRLALACIKFGNGEYESAKALYEEIARETPTNTDALLVFIALCNRNLGKISEAISGVKKYAESHPESIAARNFLGCCGEGFDSIPAGVFAAHEILRHNKLCCSSPDSLQSTVFSALASAHPEAACNLALFHVKHGNFSASLNALPSKTLPTGSAVWLASQRLKAIALASKDPAKSAAWLELIGSYSPD